MICSAVMFVASVGLIVIAHGFLPLFLGRALQGLSAGMIAVVIPLHLAEGLPASIRGRGTALFQWLLTIGIFTAFCAGSHFTNGVDAGVRAGVSGRGPAPGAGPRLAVDVRLLDPIRPSSFSPAPFS